MNFRMQKRVFLFPLEQGWEINFPTIETGTVVEGRTNKTNFKQVLFHFIKKTGKKDSKYLIGLKSDGLVILIRRPYDKLLWKATLIS